MDGIGIRIEFQYGKFPDHLKQAKACQLMMWGAAWSADYPDGENFMQLLYGPNTGQSNNGCYKSKAFSAKELTVFPGQQVSIKAAAAILAKVEAATGGIADPENIARTSDEQLRAAGLSRQKVSYLRSLAADVLSGRLDFQHLPEDDEEAIAALVHVNGIGRWTAEIYLLFAEGRSDIFPAGDLAVQIELGRILGLPDRPTEKALRTLAEPWRPHRGAAAIFAWHHRHVVPI